MSNPSHLPSKKLSIRYNLPMANSVYIAFLRGINVGGHSKVPMADLKACFADMGYSNVKTYINSGNVIFTADDTDVRELEMAIEAALEKTFSFAITVVVRTMMEMEYSGLSGLHSIIHSFTQFPALCNSYMRHNK